MTSPDVLERPQIAPEAAPSLEGIIEMSGRWLQNQADIAVSNAPRNGTMGIIQPEVPDKADEARQISQAVEHFFSSSDFDRENPRESAWKAAELANTMAGELQAPVTMTYAHTFKDSEDKLRGVTVSVGKGDVCFSSADTDQPPYEKLFHNFNKHGQLSGSEDDLDHVQIEEFEPESEDRIVLMSASVANDIAEGKVTEDDFIEALFAGDRTQTADKILGNEKGNRDKIVLIEDILPTAGSVDADSSVPPVAFVDAPKGATAANVQKQEKSGWTSSLKERWQNRKWFKRKLGRHALAGAGVDKPVTVAQLLNRLKEQDGYEPSEHPATHRSKHSAYDRSGAWFITGKTALSDRKLKRRNAYVEKHMDDDRYSDLTVEERKASIERRWDRRRIGLGLALAGALIAYRFTADPGQDGTGHGWASYGERNDHGLDLNPFGSGDKGQGDGSGLDLNPFNDTPRLNDDGIIRGHGRVVDAGPLARGGGGTAPQPAPAPLQSPSFNVNEGEGYRVRIHDYAHNNLGIPQANFDDAKAGRVDAGMEQKFGGDYITYETPQSGPDTYTRAAGDTGLRYTGPAHFDPDKIAYLNDLIRKEGATLNQ